MTTTVSFQDGFGRPPRTALFPYIDSTGAVQGFGQNLDLFLVESSIIPPYTVFVGDTELKWWCLFYLTQMFYMTFGGNDGLTAPAPEYGQQYSVMNLQAVAVA